MSCIPCRRRGMEAVLADPGGIIIRSLHVKPGENLQGRVEAVLGNTGKTGTPDAVLLLYFYDNEGRIRDRVSFKLEPIGPSENRSLSAFFRFKNTSFFSYSASISVAG